MYLNVLKSSDVLSTTNLMTKVDGISFKENFLGECHKLLMLNINYFRECEREKERESKESQLEIYFSKVYLIRSTNSQKPRQK